MTLALATVLITFSFFGTIPLSCCAVTPHSRPGHIRQAALFICNCAPGPTQQAPGYAEEESKGVWPELLKPQTEQMVKSPQSLAWVSS